MKRLSLILSILLLSFHAFAAEPVVQPPKGVHPRLLFTGERFAQIRQNLSHPENAGAVKEMEKLLGSYFSKQLRFTPVSGKTYSWSGQILAAVEAAAFKYALTGKKNYADWAYETFLNCCDSIDLTGIYDDYRPYGQMMFTAAEVYDWCYDSLSEKQKGQLYNRTLAFAKKLQIGFPPEKGSAISGHSCESQLLRAWLSVGIAMYDEYPKLWKMAAGRFYSEFVPVRKFFYESGAPNFQGSLYGPYRSLFDLWAGILVTGMGSPDPFDGMTSRWSRYFIYAFRADGMTWHIGDDHSIEKMTVNTGRYGANAFLNSVLSKDPYAKFFARELLSDFKSFAYNRNGENDDQLTPVEFLILNDVNVVPEDYRALSSASYCPSPLGEYFAASSLRRKVPGFEKEAALHLKIGEYTQANHEHQDAGSFEIFCGELLASTAGFYLSGGGGKGYRSEHTQKFYHSSISKNTLLLQSNDATYEGYGLQKSLSEVKTLDALLSDKSYQRARVTAHYDSVKDGKGIVFLSGDISNAYEGEGFVHRSMLGLFTGRAENPLVFLVYDQIDSDKKAVFLLHSLSEPVVKDSQLVISARKASSSLCNTVLLPENPSITKIGGEGHEWEVAGKNYYEGREKSVTAKSESGWGRTEITSAEKKSPRKQTLLNVMEVFSDREGAASCGPLLIQNEEFDFALVGETAVGFYKPLKENTEKDFVVELPPLQGACSVILVNLPQGSWTIEGKSFSVSAEKRIVEFTL